MRATCDTCLAMWLSSIPIEQLIDCSAWLEAHNTRRQAQNKSGEGQPAGDRLAVTDSCDNPENRKR